MNDLTTDIKHTAQRANECITSLRQANAKLKKDNKNLMAESKQLIEGNWSMSCFVMEQVIEDHKQAARQALLTEVIDILVKYYEPGGPLSSTLCSNVIHNAGEVIGRIKKLETGGFPKEHL